MGTGGDMFHFSRLQDVIDSQNQARKNPWGEKKRTVQMSVMLGLDVLMVP